MSVGGVSQAAGDPNASIMYSFALGGSLGLLFVLVVGWVGYRRRLKRNLQCWGRDERPVLWRPMLTSTPPD
jgi:hypothetical protein